MKFGDFFHEKRIGLMKTLRQFCIENSLNAGNISKMERGVLPPPQDPALLAKYAQMLGLIEGSDDWETFHDLAYAQNGQIPADIMSDESLIDKLPVFFRTLRGEKLSDDKLDKLIDTVRKA